MRECWAFYPVVVYFSKEKSGIRKAFSARIRWLREAGLMEHWLSEETGAAARRAAGRHVALVEDVRLGLGEHLKGVFVTLLACLGACVLAFSWEVLRRRC